MTLLPPFSPIHRIQTSLDRKNSSSNRDGMELFRDWATDSFARKPVHYRSNFEFFRFEKNSISRIISRFEKKRKKNETSEDKEWCSSPFPSSHPNLQTARKLGRKADKTRNPLTYTVRLYTQGTRRNSVDSSSFQGDEVVFLALGFALNSGGGWRPFQLKGRGGDWISNPPPPSFPLLTTLHRTTLSRRING